MNDVGAGRRGGAPPAATEQGKGTGQGGRRRWEVKKLIKLKISIWAQIVRGWLEMYVHVVK